MITFSGVFNSKGISIQERVGDTGMRGARRKEGAWGKGDKVGCLCPWPRIIRARGWLRKYLANHIQVVLEVEQSKLFRVMSDLAWDVWQTPRSSAAGVEGCSGQRLPPRMSGRDKLSVSPWGALCPAATENVECFAWVLCFLMLSPQLPLSWLIYTNFALILCFLKSITESSHLGPGTSWSSP